MMMWKSIAFLILLFANCSLLGQLEIINLSEDNWREHANYISPQPDSKYHNVCTRLVVRTGGQLNLLGITQDDSLISIEGDQSGIHEYEITTSRDRRTINIIPRTNFVLEEQVTIVIHGGIIDLESNEEVALEWSFFTSAKVPDAWTFEPPVTEENGERVFPNWTVIEGPWAGVAEGNYFSGANAFDGGIAIKNMDVSNLEWVWEDGDRGQDFKVNLNGLLTYAHRVDRSWRVMDENAVEIDSLYALNGYMADNHDFQIEPDWTHFIFSYDDQEVDMSEVVDGGHPAAIVEGFVIQEIDVEGNVIMEWRSWDHFELTDNEELDLTGDDLHLFHINSLEIDDDDNIMISCRHLSEITKYNRETGDIIWRWGNNSQNQFQFLPTAAFSYQHDLRRLANGNLLLFDNANLTTQLTRVVEYSMNEETYEVDVVWEYAHPDALFGASMGGVQRLGNGNTTIYWGNVNNDDWGGRCTEVDFQGNILLEFAYDIPTHSYRLPKHDWFFGEVLAGCGDPLAENYDPEVVASYVTECVYDLDGDGYLAEDDCDDLDDTIYPGAEEIPDDGIDQDCNGSDLEINDLDLDGDGFSTEEGDCNDDDDTIYPDAEEIPYDGIDQDCDGEDLTDVDGDGYSPEDGDCDDNDADINPDIEEIPYDGIDQDCDGEDLTDVDGDGYSPEDGDCDDENEDIGPEIVEIPYDGIDQDCDGEDLTDVDGDGYSPDDGDCDDTNEDISPEGVEIPNDGIDQDCDGEDLIVGLDEIDLAQVQISHQNGVISVSGNQDMIDQMTLYNSSGQMVISYKFNGKHILSDLDFSAGLYILTLVGADYAHSINLIIQ